MRWFSTLALGFTFSSCFTHDQFMGKVAVHFLGFKWKPKLSRYRKIALIRGRVQKCSDVTFNFGGHP